MPPQDGPPPGDKNFRGSKMSRYRQQIEVKKTSSRTRYKIERDQRGELFLGPDIKFTQVGFPPTGCPIIGSNKLPVQRQTDRQTDRQTYRQTDRQTDRPMDKVIRSQS